MESRLNGEMLPCPVGGKPALYSMFLCLLIENCYLDFLPKNRLFSVDALYLANIKIL